MIKLYQIYNQYIANETEIKNIYEDLKNDTLNEEILDETEEEEDIEDDEDDEDDENAFDIQNSLGIDSSVLDNYNEDIDFKTDDDIYYEKNFKNIKKHFKKKKKTLSINDTNILNRKYEIKNLSAFKTKNTKLKENFFNNIYKEKTKNKINNLKKIKINYLNLQKMEINFLENYNLFLNNIKIDNPEGDEEYDLDVFEELDKQDEHYSYQYNKVYFEKKIPLVFFF